MTALARCQPPVTHTPLPEDVVCRLDDDISNDLAAATVALKNQTVQKLFRPTDHGDMSKMHVEYDSKGRAIRAIVTILPTPTAEPTYASRTIVNPGQPMPYIRLPSTDLPTLSTTVRLHSLSAEHEFVFRVLMDTMQRHIDKEENIPQLTMSVLGNAGKVQNIFVRISYMLIVHLCRCWKIQDYSSFAMAPFPTQCFTFGPCDILHMEGSYAYWNAI